MRTDCRLERRPAEDLTIRLISSAFAHQGQPRSRRYQNAAGDPDLPGSAAVNLVMQVGTLLGGWRMAKGALAAESHPDSSFGDAKIKTAHFYCRHILPRAAAYAEAAMAGPELVMALPAESF